MALAFPSDRNQTPTVATKFSVFLVEPLNREERYGTILIDGRALRWDSARHFHQNILRGLCRVFPKKQFYLIHDESVAGYQFREANLIHVKQKFDLGTVATIIGNTVYDVTLRRFIEVEVIRRIAGGVYCLVNREKFAGLNTVRSLIDFAREEVRRTAHLHCVTISEPNIRCYYIDLDGSVSESTERPTGGIWLSDQENPE